MFISVFGLTYMCKYLLWAQQGAFSKSYKNFIYKVSYICHLPNEYSNWCFISFLEDGVVLVHCNAGVSRAAAIVIGFLMNSERLSFARAFSVVKNARPAACPNPGFMEQLHKYQEQIVKANGSINSHDWSEGRSEATSFDYTGTVGCTFICRFEIPFYMCIFKSLYIFSYPPLTLFFFQHVTKRPNGVLTSEKFCLKPEH